MKKTFLNLLLVILPFIGLFDSGYVTYEIFSNRIPVCTPPFQCALFLENEWAFIAGLPLSVYGLVFYSIVMVLAIMNFLEIRNVKKLLKGMAVFGFLFALYVSFIMGWVVKAWCLWCVISAVNLSILFIASRFLKTTTEAATPQDN